MKKKGAPITLFWYDEVKKCWVGEDFDSVHQAAEYAGYGLGDCDMRMLIWKWEPMQLHSVQEAWEMP